MRYSGKVGLLLALGACAALADVPRISRLLPGSGPPAEVLRGESVSVFPEWPHDSQKSPDAKAAPVSKADRLQPRTRLEIIRYVSGEFARARRPIPGGKQGFRFVPGTALKDDEVRAAIMRGGTAASAGDNVQITDVQFKEREIWVDINGGGKTKRRLRDRIQVSVGGFPSVSSTNPNATPGFQGLGSTLILDFGRPLPDVSADELKTILGVFLDFSRQRSASVAWVDTLPPEFQQAIKERRAMVGMDREMVIAALGRPEKRIRERREEDGLETEDWVYGHPPGKTIFVKFADEKVISVKQFP